MDFLVNQSYNAVSYAALLFLLGSGMSLIFGVMKIINVAHGAFYLVGGYIGYVIVRQTGNFYLALLVACLGVALLGMVIERLLLRGLEGQTLRQMLMTFGIADFDSGCAPADLQGVCLQSQASSLVFNEPQMRTLFLLPVPAFHDRGGSRRLYCLMGVTGKDSGRSDCEGSGG